MRHYHYIVQGYKAETNDGGLSDVATIDVILMPDAQPKITQLSDSRRWSKSDLEQAALERAAAMVSKQNYRARDVIEHDDGVCEVKR